MKRSLLALLLFGCGSGFSMGAHEGALDGGTTDSGTGGRAGLGSGGATGSGGAARGSGGAARGSGGAAIGAGGAAIGAGGEADSGTAGDAGSGGVTGAGGAGDDGGTLSAGGTTGTGGSVACTLITHDNGLGQTWRDCVPFGTWNESQAMKACVASGAATCHTVTVCGPSLSEVRGYSADSSKVIGRWGYAGVLAGYVGTGALGELCLGANDSNNRVWK